MTNILQVIVALITLIDNRENNKSNYKQPHSIASYTNNWDVFE